VLHALVDTGDQQADQGARATSQFLREIRNFLLGSVAQPSPQAAARHDGVTVIRNASSNYTVRELCFSLR
jgi:hypothetical protein